MGDVKTTVLTIEDDAAILKLLKVVLEADHFKVIEAKTAKDGISMATSFKPDLILLDLGLPDMNGTDVIGAIRSWSNVPIIVCSVQSDDKDVIQALDLGADDYVNKPFNPDILLARLKSNLRRWAKKENGQPQLKNGAICMDLVKHETSFDGQKMDLTPKEHDLLKMFLVNKGKMLTHKQILQEIWGPAHAEDTQYLRVYMSQLREKINKHSPSQSYIMTEAGIGYRMEIKN